MRDAFGFLFGDHVQVHQVGGSGGLTRSYDNAENIFRLEQAPADKILLGQRNHFCWGMGLTAAHRTYSPIKIHPAENSARRL